MRPVVLLCFFLSGASGLIFELLWTRMLTLVFGSTTLAVSTVLATFMGGLGLGSYLAGRFADRLRRPVLVYALAEACIGVYALAIPWAIGHYEPLNHWLWTTFGDRYTVLSLLRFGAAALLLLLPTTLMGATLPVLARHFVSRPGELRRIGGNLGTLYAINLFGACAGSFLAGFVFLPALGVASTNRVAAAFNLTLAALAVLAHGRLGRAARARVDLDELLAEAAAAGDAAAAQALAPRPHITPAARKAAIVGFAVSGAVAMTLQVLWTRALAVVVGSSIFSFTIILLAFLIGLGGGSALLGGRADRTRHPVAWLGATHLGIAFAVGASYLLIDKLPFVFTFLLSSTKFGVDAVLFCQFVLVCLTVLPSTLLMGAVFPLTMRIATGELETVGRDVGGTYAVNTIGAIIGSFLAGFVVLPGLGLQRGIYVAVGAGLALALVLFLLSPGLAPSRRRLGAATAVALAVVGLLLPRWNLTNFSAGFFRTSIARDYIARKEARKSWRMPELIFYEDGIATTVSVDRWDNVFSMKNNGKVDASSDADMPTQISVGLLPLLLAPTPKAPRVALIGFGSGVTAGSITQYPIASLEVVELEPAIYRASRFFDHVNHEPLDNPRVTARVGDGRNFLSQRDDRFDVIISQPSNPWITGVSNLFTREYFQQIKRRLAEGGVFCQWAQLYEMSPWNVKTIYRTLASEFAHVMVFAAEDLSSDTILIASQQPLPIDLQRLAQRFSVPAVHAEAARAGWQSPHDVVAQLLLGPDEVPVFTAGAAINTDDNALIEFAAPRDMLGFARHDSYLARVYGAAWPYGRLLGLVTGWDATAPADDMGRLARSLIAHGRMREARFWLARADTLGGGPAVEHARTLMELLATRLDRDPEVALAPEEGLTPPRLPGRITAAVSERLASQWTEIEALVKARKFVSAYKVMEDWPAEIWRHPDKDFALLAGFLHYKAEFYDDAIGLLKQVAEVPRYVKRRPEALYYLGRAHFVAANHDKAVAALERYMELQGALGRPVVPRGNGAAVDDNTAAPARL